VKLIHTLNGGGGGYLSLRDLLESKCQALKIFRKKITTINSVKKFKNAYYLAGDIQK